MEAPAHARAPRFWLAVQPSIVRIYKIAGLFCLTAILVALLGFLTINIFYFFDHSWVRPVRFKQGDAIVIEATHQLAEAKLRASQLAAEKLDIEAQLTDIDNTVERNEKFIAGAGELVATPRTSDQWMLRRQIDEATLERDSAMARRIPLNTRLSSLKARIDDQQRMVDQLSLSPYLKAPTVLAFVPNENKESVRVGTDLFSCAWGIVRCANVGTVLAILDGEITGTHPNNESSKRGFYAVINVSETGGDASVLFAGGKPLWLF